MQCEGGSSDAEPVVQFAGHGLVIRTRAAQRNPGIGAGLRFAPSLGHKHLQLLRGLHRKPWDHVRGMDDAHHIS